ncbi:hypothetical protein BJV82DRAFT_654707 [Fennellomyces sp. T-0311]|nr:hypothetical protein BJV82DRAFT_654707 [Fennellomyces sp. T-0311]
MRTLAFINALRFSLLITSSVTLTTHAAQCTLYSVYQHQTSIPDWFKAGHWQYLLWYISLSLSVLSAIAICIHAGCCRRSHILRGDKTLSIINALTLSVTILLITFFGGQEPWTAGLVEFKQPARGFLPYCGLLDAKADSLYPLLYHRCLLVDATWIGACMTCMLWMLLLPFAAFTKPLRRASSVGKLPTESNWGKYEPRQHNSVRTQGSSAKYSSTTPLTQHQVLPEPTLPNMYHTSTAENDYYGRNYSGGDYAVTATTPTHHTTTMPITPNTYYYDEYREPPVQTPQSENYYHYPQYYR